MPFLAETDVECLRQGTTPTLDALGPDGQRCGAESWRGARGGARSTTAAPARTAAANDSDPDENSAAEAGRELASALRVRHSPLPVL